mmetsp:Transcript_28005/g.67492  ORF Transcript_28005/g.67492 Transcript_28005/m.67492 type:complete len:425 (+) Transcript_28005:396-1670(+)
MQEFALHTHGNRVNNPIHRNGLRYLMLSLLFMMHMNPSIVDSSSSPIAMFTPPLQVHPQQSSLSRGRDVRFGHRNSHRKSSISEPSVSNSYQRRNARSMSKIKSPSNSYTQFYKEGVLVGIERTSPNSRRISGELIMDIPIDAIWEILTDYNNLSAHVPNLVESRVINNGRRIVGDRPRVYQKGAQRIFGFEFGADVTMDMTESIHHDGQQNSNAATKMCSVDFKCVDSQFFSQFDGSWILEEYSNSKTMVRYIVDVRPKGPVPVYALEWRIQEDVPVNILAVSNSARAQNARMDRVQTIETEQEGVVEPRPEIQQLSRLPQPQSNPLQQLADRAANNLKQTAKSVLPSPLFSTAKRAINAMYGPISKGRPSAGPVPSMSLNGGSSDAGAGKTSGDGKMNLLSSRDSIVDWYEDETLAMYVKDY